MNWLQGILSDFIGLWIKPEKDIHNWATIIAILGFLILVGILASAVSG